MQVVNECAQLLTNAEVYELLDGIRKSRRTVAQRGSAMKNLATLTHTAHKFLAEQTPAPSQTNSAIAAFLGDIANLQLSRQEALQIVNLCPRSAVEVHVIVDDCDQRLTDEQVQRVLDLVATRFLAGAPGDSS